MFVEAIKTEQRRIERFVGLSRSGSAERGSLYIQKQGDHFYAFERWQGKEGHMRKVYLGSLESEAVQELFADKFKAKRLTRLWHDQKLLEKLERQYQEYDFDSIVAEMPKAYRMAARNNSFDQRIRGNPEVGRSPVPQVHVSISGCGDLCGRRDPHAFQGRMHLVQSHA